MEARERIESRVRDFENAHLGAPCGLAPHGASEHVEESLASRSGEPHKSDIHVGPSYYTDPLLVRRATSPNANGVPPPLQGGASQPELASEYERSGNPTPQNPIFVEFALDKRGTGHLGLLWIKLEKNGRII